MNSFSALGQSEFIESTIAIENKNDHAFYFYWHNLFLEKPEIIQTPNYTINEVIIKHNYPIRVISNDATRKSTYGIHTSFMIYPGESLKIYKNKFGNTKIISGEEGYRNNELNFFAEMGNKIGEFEGFGVGLVPLSLSDDEMVEEVNQKWNKRINFLEQYKLRKPISTEFVDYLRNSFKYMKYSDILFPYLSPYCHQKKILTQPIINFLEEEFKLNDRFFYLHEYRSAVLSYLVYLSGNSKKVEWINLYNIALSQLTGDTKEVLLFDILRLAFQENQKLAYPIYQSYIKYATNPIFKDYVVKNYRPQFESLKINSSSLVSQGDKKGYILEDIVNGQYPYTYLDFWASWCGPCRAEMPGSKKLSEDYTKKGINFVYISIDDNVEAWEKASKQIGLPVVNSYLLPNSKNSAIAKDLNISTIPRYVIIGKDGKIINADALRPNDPKIRKLFDELLEN